MSTFDGVVREFPDIRIDRFIQGAAATPPLACFLSHVHTDHLLGLESYHSPFIYCSSATRDILLKLEKYPHRINFAKGILETRKRTYRHLHTLLKPIPLEVPTDIDLTPQRKIRVTLFDANHCVGAVMFLIEDDGNAILYTGDIRSEAWWVNTLIRNPVLLPYVASTDYPPLKRLDNIYLDTTFAAKQDRYREFPSKASGLTELLRAVDLYPKDTLFYFDAWTFGYEEVWQALSHHLKSRIHVDDYRYNVYKSLNQSKEMRAPEAFKLISASIGNHDQKGCLSKDDCRIHSCERGMGCNIWDKQFVRITPIISRHDGMDMEELGAGGGHGDLNQQHEIEIGNGVDYARLMELCYSELKGQEQLRDGVFETIKDAMNNSTRNITIALTDVADEPSDRGESDDIPLIHVVRALAKHVARTKQMEVIRQRTNSAVTTDGTPKQIKFPYSRHSSYNELEMLVAAFKPKEIHPCTVAEHDWDATQSMVFLFGHLYDGATTFRHDQAMMAEMRQVDMDDNRVLSQETQAYEERQKRRASSPRGCRVSYDHRHPKRRKDTLSDDLSLPTTPDFYPLPLQTKKEPLPSERLVPAENPHSSRHPHRRVANETIPESRPATPWQEHNVESRRTSSGDPWANEHVERGRAAGNEHLSQISPSAETNEDTERFVKMTSEEKRKELRIALQHEAYRAALGDGVEWSEMGLVSVNGYHMEKEEQL